jgi:hypothetical protein
MTLRDLELFESADVSCNLSMKADGWETSQPSSVQEATG